MRLRARGIPACGFVPEASRHAASCPRYPVAPAENSFAHQIPHACCEGIFMGSLRALGSQGVPLWALHGLRRRFVGVCC